MSCQAITKSGLRCRNHPMGDTNYCRSHTPRQIIPVATAVSDERCQCVRTDGRQCTKRAVKGTPYCSAHRRCYRTLTFENTDKARQVLPASIIDTVEHLFDPEYFRDLKVMHVVRDTYGNRMDIVDKIKRSGVLSAEFDKNAGKNIYKCIYFTLYLEPIFRKIPEIYDAFIRKYESEYFLVINNINHFFNSSLLLHEHTRARHGDAFFPTIRVVPEWAYGRGTNVYANDRENNINLSAYAVNRIKDEVYRLLLSWKKHTTKAIVNAIMVAHEVTLCRRSMVVTGKDYTIPLDEVEVQWHRPGDPFPI